MKRYCANIKSFRIESYKSKRKMQQLTLIFDNIDTSKRGLSGFYGHSKEVKCEELVNIINKHIKSL